MSTVKIKKKFAEISGGSIGANVRLEFANPFPDYFVECKIEVKHDRQWGNPEWFSSFYESSGDNLAWGVRVNQMENTLVVQSGKYGIINSSSESGNPFNSGSSSLPPVADNNEIPFRIFVFRKNKMPDYMKTLTGSNGFTTIESITESGTWTAPKTGYYRVTCIGGGGGGGGRPEGSPNASFASGTGGNQGETTIFDYIKAEGGSGGGGGAGFGGGGGATGETETSIIKLDTGQVVNVIIGKGGQGGTGSSRFEQGGETGEGAHAGKGTLHGHQSDGGAAGASNGSPSFSNVGDNVGNYYNPGNGGAGATHIYKHGNGGGGGASVYLNGVPNIAYGGAAGKNAFYGQDGSDIKGGNGGSGGSGAVILEY